MMLLLVVVCGVSSTLALDNGLALTPPMGWLTWERYRCLTDCNAYPDECISEKLIKRTADIMVNEGYLEAGYNYIAIDDCWPEKKRSADGKLVPDHKRFPSGMKLLAKYVHSKGLKFGIYEDYGKLTCAGYPGVMGHEQTDVDTLVSWDVDYIKLDGCGSNAEQMQTGYPEFGKMLNASGRPILYSCSWPAYLESMSTKPKPNYTLIAENCNLWRNWADIDDSWHSVESIMNWFGDHQDLFASIAGPGNWNDPDMLLVGNFGLSLDQARVQMAVWAVMAAPLLMSADLTRMRPEFKEILINRDVIAVNQDKLGKQGLRVYKKSNKQIWTRELSGDSYAVAFVSTRSDGVPYHTSFTADEIKIPAQKYTVVDLYNEEQDRVYDAKDEFETRINPTGVKFYKFTPKKEDSDEIDGEMKDNINEYVNNHLDKTVIVV